MKQLLALGAAALLEIGGVRVTMAAPRNVVSVPFTLDNAVVETTGRMLTFGVPLGKGQIRAAPPWCRVFRGATKLAAECRILAQWDDNSAKWLKVAFLPDADALKNREVPLRLDVSRVTPAPLRASASSVAIANVSADGKRVSVNNGRMRFDVGVGTPGAIGAISYGNSRAASRVDLQLIDDKSVAYQGVLTKPPAVEENGPNFAVLRLDGRYAKNADTFQNFVLRLEIARGLPYFTVHHTLVVTSPDMQTRGIQSVKLRLSTPSLGSSRTAGVVYDTVRVDHRDFAPAPLRTAKSASVTFDAVDSVTFRVDSAKRTGARGLGFMEMARSHAFVTGVAVRNPHEEFPLTIDLKRTPREGHVIEVDLWPANLLKEWPARADKLDLKNTVSASGYICIGTGTEEPVVGKTTECLSWRDPQKRPAILAALVAHPDWPILATTFQGTQADLDDFLATCETPSDAGLGGRPGLCKNRPIITDSKGSYSGTARGIAKTHAIAIYMRPIAEAGLGAKLASVLSRESFARLNPATIMKSGVFEAYQLPTAGVLDAINNKVRLLLERGILSDTNDRLFGFLRYGNETSLHAHSVFNLGAFYGDSKYSLTRNRGFFNQEAHDILASAWWLYLRLGTRAAWEYATKKSRAHTDLLTIWSHAIPDYVGLQRRHSMQPWSNEAHTTHSLAEGLSLYHFLSGQGRPREAVLNMAEAAVRDFDDEFDVFGRYGLRAKGRVGTSLRGHTAMWLALVRGYELTRKAEYRRRALEFKSRLARVQHETGEIPTNILVLPVTCSVCRQVGAHAVGCAAAQNPVRRLVTDGPSGVQGHAFSLSLAVRAHTLVIGRDAELSLVIRKWADFALWSMAAQSIEGKQSNAYWLLAEAFAQNREDAKYLAYFLALESYAAQADNVTPTGWGRLYLPREVGYYMRAALTFFERHTRDDILRAFNAVLLGAPPSRTPPRFYRDGRDINLKLREDTDRSFELTWHVGYHDKNGRAGAAFEVVNPAGAVVYCRNYYQCDPRAVDAGVSCGTKLQAKCGPERNQDEFRASGAVVSCTNTQPLKSGPHHFVADDCTLSVPKDNVAGDYALVVRPLSLVPDSGEVHTPEQLAANLGWQFDTNLTNATGLIPRGIRHDLSGGGLALTIDRTDFVLDNSTHQATRLTLDTTNRVAGLARTSDLDAGVVVQSANGRWTGQPASLTVPGGLQENAVSIRAHAGIDFQSGLSLRRIRLAEAEGQARSLWLPLGSIEPLLQIPLLNGNFEQRTANACVSTFDSWQQTAGRNNAGGGPLPGLCVEVATGNAAPEQAAAVRFTFDRTAAGGGASDSITLEQRLPEPVRAGERYRLRYLGNINRESLCKAELAYAYVLTGSSCRVAADCRNATPTCRDGVCGGSVKGEVYMLSASDGARLWEQTLAVPATLAGFPVAVTGASIRLRTLSRQNLNVDRLTCVFDAIEFFRVIPVADPESGEGDVANPLE